MADNSEKSRLERVAEVLNRHGVEFLVIGGEAATLHGSPLTTFDTDLCYKRDADNLRRLAAALREIHVTLRGAPADLPFRVDEFSLGLGCNFTFTSSLGDIDLLGEVEPIGGFDALIERAVSYDLGGVPVRIISLDDLIHVKEYLGRPKDKAALYQLVALKRLIEGRGTEP